MLCKYEGVKGRKYIMASIMFLEEVSLAATSQGVKPVGRQYRALRQEHRVLYFIKNGPWRNKAMLYDQAENLPIQTVYYNTIGIRIEQVI